MTVFSDLYLATRVVLWSLHDWRAVWRHFTPNEQHAIARICLERTLREFQP